MNGVLLIDKPAGWTSFDVVNYVRGIIARAEGKKPKQVKVGHTGTLDPLATGLLVLLLGTYTKRAPELTKLDKSYEVTMKLGQTSSTGDEEGEKKAVSDSQPSEIEIKEVIAQFTGKLMQSPPQYSAIKVDGKRAYELARSGKTVDLKARPVTVYDSLLTEYRYPEVSFTVNVSSGTYIRSLVEDMGSRLQTGAYTTSLRRLSVGEYSVEQALPVEGLGVDDLEKHLISFP